MMTAFRRICLFSVLVTLISSGSVSRCDGDVNALDPRDHRRYSASVSHLFCGYYFCHGDPFFHHHYAYHAGVGVDGDACVSAPDHDLHLLHPLLSSEPSSSQDHSSLLHMLPALASL